MHSKEVINWLNIFHTNEFLDFGSNTTGLSREWNVSSCTLFNLESAVPHDYVVCTGILEHISRKHHLSVMLELERLTQKEALIIIDVTVDKIYKDTGIEMELDHPGRWEHWLGQFFWVHTVELSGDYGIFQVRKRDFETLKSTPRKVR